MITADSEWSAMLGSRFHSSYYSETEFRDLLSFLEGMIDRAGDASVLSAAIQARNNFLSGLIANHSSASEDAHGFSIYLTSVGDTPSPSYSGTNIQFAADTQWDEMLLAAGTKTIPDDVYENNDSFTQAWSIDTGSYNGLCCKDEDWFKFYLPVGAEVTISLYHDFMAGDLDIELYNSSQVMLDSSTNWFSDLELMFEEITTPGYYYLKVYGFDGDQNYYYDFNVLNAHDDPGYTWKEIPYEFADYSGSVALGLGDDDSREIDLGFTFEYYDIPYTNVRISTNGYLTFGGSGSVYNNKPMPLPGQPDAFIAPFWDDFMPREGQGDVLYKIVGPTGRKKLIVTWLKCLCWTFWDLTPGDGTVQAILSEEDGTIQFNYLDVYFSDPNFDFGRSATVGLENEDGTRSCLYSYFETNLANNKSLMFYPEGYTAAGSPWHLYE
jgi:hypothetical protein